jgi:hypothetical protein
MRILAEQLRAAIAPNAGVAPLDARTQRHHLISSAQISTFSGLTQVQARPAVFKLNANTCPSAASQRKDARLKINTEMRLFGGSRSWWRRLQPVGFGWSTITLAATNPTG